MDKVRTRFAPSPTGYMHVGGIRTALFAWLYAKHTGGDFILRIEDTDKKREVEGSIEHIIKCLNSLGIEYDEGPDKPSRFGPFRQSERLAIYQTWAEKLIQNGRAYPDPYTPKELESFRAQSIAEHKPFLYRNHRPGTTSQWDKTKPLRFKSDPKAYHWNDAVMGELSSGQEAVDDFVLIKSDGFPTYNFAHIVDDYEMQITHIMRGHEFIASTPNYLNLYEALNIDHPIFATPPPVMGPSGNKKLSKRDGAKDILEYIDEGYLTEALINYIVSLGWNDGSTQEIYTINELIQSFSLDRLQKSGARFDERRLIWMNGNYIRNLTINELSTKAKDFWPAEASRYDDDYKNNVLKLVQERLKLLSELQSLSIFFFIDLPINHELISNNKKLGSYSKQQLEELLKITSQELATSNFTVEDLTDKLNHLLTITNQTPAVLFSLIRIATTQAPASPPLAESMALLGKERVIARIDNQLKDLKE